MQISVCDDYNQIHMSLNIGDHTEKKSKITSEKSEKTMNWKQKMNGTWRRKCVLAIVLKWKQFHKDSASQNAKTFAMRAFWRLNE